MLDTNKDFDDLNLAESDEALEAALNYLKYHDPANANREYALGLLAFMNRVAKEVADKSDLDFEAFVARYNESLSLKKD
jgi:anti-sigma-K factor RskA